MISEVKCSGLIWTIPDDRVKATIAELDYRERGGYHRFTPFYDTMKMTRDSKIFSGFR
jgi:cation transport regulator ChaC